MYAIRRSSDGKLETGTFDTHKFRRDLAKILFGSKGPFDEKTLDAISERAIRRLETSLLQARTLLSESEYRARPDIVGAIPDVLITHAVERELKEGRDKPYRMAELLWIMAIRGRRATPDRWEGAEQVVKWIHGRYNISEAPLKQPGYSEQSLRLPAANPTSWRPEDVYKRNGQTATFSMAQFEKSIDLALWGREDARAKSMMIAHMVLGELRGQRVVHSSQLAVSVLTVLRRVDDFGYLKWSVFLKEIVSVRRFAVEAADLINHPSPRLQLKSEWTRRAKDLWPDS